MRSFFAIVLTLTLTSAFAAYTASNYEIAPVTIAQASDTNFTNLRLVSLAPDSLHLLSETCTINSSNVSASNWNLFYRQLNLKAFSTQNTAASIVAPPVLFYLNNYAVGFSVDNTTGALNLWAYQVPLISGITVPGRLQLSRNLDISFNVTSLTTSQIGNTVYVAYHAANLTVNITSFTIGATVSGTPFTLSTTFDTLRSLYLTWGEALGSSQLFAVWIENGVLKDVVINVSTGTVPTPTVVHGYSKQLICLAFATDEKLYGELCVYLNLTTGIVFYYVRTTANGTLVQMANYTFNSSVLSDFIPYGPYLAVFFQDIKGFHYSYEIWDLSTFKTTSVQGRKQYLTIDSNSTQIPFRVVSGGYYTLLYNNKQGNGTLTNVQVGLLLGRPVSGSLKLLQFLSSLQHN